MEDIIFLAVLILSFLGPLVEDLSRSKNDKKQ
jgi:hypothetical protein